MRVARTGRRAPGPDRLSVLLLLLPSLLLGCSTATPPARDPAAEAAPPAAEGATSPAASERPAPEDKAPLTLPPPQAGVPDAGASCPAGAPLPEAQAPCATALADLARALGGPEAASDAALTQLEACSEFPPGVVRALRAERLPACADQLVQPALADGATQAAIDPVLRQTLVALGFAGRLSRLVGSPPSAGRSSSKAELEAYLQDTLFPWAALQAKAIADISRAGASMRGYARGLIAIEAALADLRFVEMARALPLPVEMQAAEVKSEYYAALDEALEPRKDRARDAALVGLGEFSALGIWKATRVEQARQVIARVFAGSRILALDALLVPPAPSCARATPAQVVAASVESPYAASLLAGIPLTLALTTCLLTRGLPLHLARQLDADESVASRFALARAYFELGRTYMNAEAFQRAAALYAKDAGRADGPRADEDHLLSMLSHLLTAVPANAAELFRIGTRLPTALGATAQLEELASLRSPVAGAAAFDAAYLQELVAADGSVAQFQAVAGLYERASKKLSGKERALAVERARAAEATARALEKRLK